MDVKEAIQKRRAYRSLEKTEITRDVINELAVSAQLAASCYNKQPWRFVFVYEEEVLTKLHEALSQGNEWAQAASLIMAVFTRKDFDCLTGGREYYLFDTGMATGSLVLRATELGLVAHPIAGFDEEKTKQILNIPDDMLVITLVIVGKHSSGINPLLNEQQAEVEKTRPERLPFEKFACLNRYSEKIQDEPL